MAECQADLIVLGASFAGLELVYQLRRQGYWKGAPERRVLVIDRVERSPYIPLLHEGLLRASAARPMVEHAAWLRAMPGVDFVKGDVERVDAAHARVQLQGARDYQAAQLVIALGSRLVAPAHVDSQGLALLLKSGAQREALQNRLRSLSKGARVAVVGGGLSGVELAAQLAHEGPNLQLHLLHQGERLLPSLAARAGRLSQRRLQQLGVSLHLGVRVEKVMAEGLRYVERGGESSFLPAELCCWAGGVSAGLQPELQGAKRDDAGWLCVDPALRLRRAPAGRPFERVYAIGDIAAIYQDSVGEAQPTMRRAIEAIWQAKSLARNLVASGPGQKAHSLRMQWPYGVSVGPSSLLCYRDWAVDLRWLGRWFRRWLQEQHAKRYR